MSGPDALEARVTALEARAAHADRVIEDLSATVAKQWRKIDALVAETLRLRDRLEDAATRDPRAPEPPPPHY